jgi:hypothetical protein
VSPLALSDLNASPNAGAGLLTSLQHFDEFELPAEGIVGHGRTDGGEGGAAGSEDAIFALDEEQASPTGSSGGSPRLTGASAAASTGTLCFSGTSSGVGGGALGSTESLSMLEDRGDGGGLSDEEDEDEEAGLSEEEGEDDEPVSAAPISRKAASLLGVDGGGRNSRTNSTSTTSSSGIIRPRTASGSKGGVTMVPMSLPIQIPQQLRAVGEEGATGAGAAADRDANPTRVAHTPAKAHHQSSSSLLGRSLQNRPQAGPAAAVPPPQMSSGRRYSSDSSSDEDGEKARKRGTNRADGAFVPPHTLVEQPFFSFAKVRHLASPSSRPPDSVDAAGTASASGAQPISILPPVSAPGEAFHVPASSSVPRMVGSLGMRKMVTAPGTSVSSQQGGHGQLPPVAAAAAAPAAASSSSKLGFSAVNVPPPKSSSSAARGQQPSSRNPTQQQQQQQR